MILTDVCIRDSVTVRFHFHFPLLLATRCQLYEILIQVSHPFSLLDFVFFLLIWKEFFKCSEYKPLFSYMLSKYFIPLLSCLSLCNSWVHKRLLYCGPIYQVFLLYVFCLYIHLFLPCKIIKIPSHIFQKLIAAFYTEDSRSPEVRSYI